MPMVMLMSDVGYLEMETILMAVVMVEQVVLTNKSWSWPALPSTGVHCRSPGATGTCTRPSRAHKAVGWKSRVNIGNDATG